MSCSNPACVRPARMVSSERVLIRAATFTSPPEYELRCRRWCHECAPVGAGPLGPDNPELDAIAADMRAALRPWLERQGGPVEEASSVIRRSLEEMGPVPGGAEFCSQLKFALISLDRAKAIIDAAKAGREREGDPDGR